MIPSRMTPSRNDIALRARLQPCRKGRPINRALAPEEMETQQ
jgi:hypothetical protein